MEMYPTCILSILMDISHLVVMWMNCVGGQDLEYTTFIVEEH